ncbi:MAG: basic amino acid ABC transporter substrate-binding protein [Nitrospinota bacterium]|nr:basic amino acid ABC transporter substrate-binding protein [Nitrospinota bacterium]
MSSYPRISSFIYAVFLALLTALLPACGDSGSAPKKITVATDATLVPMSFMNDQGQIDGFDRALMEAIAKEAGMQIEMVNVEWAGLLGGLTTGKYDAAISSITILEERKKKMGFSIPYLKSGLAIVVRKETEGIATMDDLLKNNMMVGAQRGTTAYFFLNDHPAIRNVGYESYGHAVQDLIKGELDAVIGESTGTLYYKNKDKPVFEKIKMAGEILTDEYYGIAVRPDKPALIQTINKALNNLLANGTVERLHQQWDLGQAAVIPATGEQPTAG